MYHGDNTMNRRHLLNALAIPLLAGRCAPPASSPRPAPGAPTADAAFPAIGAKWKVRVTESSLFHRGTEDKDIIAAAASFQDRPAYGLVSATETKMLDPATFNLMGSVKGGNVATTSTPDIGPFSWPLWAGKSWGLTYSYADLEHGRAWPPAKARIQVAALEDVTVPAGTFHAFRIELEGGIDSGASGSRAHEPGFRSHNTYWYAPAPKTIVRSVIERYGDNYLFAGWTVTELLSVPT